MNSWSWIAFMWLFWVLGAIWSVMMPLEIRYYGYLFYIPWGICAGMALYEILKRRRNINN